MIAVSVQNFDLNKLAFNWFDVALVVILLFGLFRGRKNGMTKELVPLLRWLTLVVVCGLSYGTAAQTIANTAAVKKPASLILGYLLLAFVVFVLFAIIKRIVIRRDDDGKTFFGGGEYYFGMLSGMVRAGCIVLVVLAFLNAPTYTAADLREHENYVKRWFGGGLYNGDFFPDLHTVQEQVFRKSYTGHYITNYFDMLLIHTGPLVAAPPPPQKHPVVNIQK
jgi:uncharacterized membrane protein required for colicin V production